MTLSRSWLLAVVFLTVATACSSPAPPQADPIVTPAKPANAEAEKGPSPTSPAPPAPQPAQIRISREQAIQIIQRDTRGNAQVSAVRLVELVTRGKEPVMMALWVVDLGDGTTPQGYVVIDATTGDVLNVTNAHSGQ